jgi:vitamin B12/bleomycin/antimicrobial peptide transport system ATP-binding/permease protein
MFGGIVALLICISGLNVLSSYVGRDLMTSIERRSAASFFSNALLSMLVFGALTGAAVLLRFVEEQLALLWREWMTRKLLADYLAGGVYLRLRERGELGNPDQRIAEDARAFTGTTLSFVLIFLNAGLAIIAFSGVMWSISPLLFGVAVGYAALGSLFTVLMGRPLVRLNYDQSDREASFRTELVHLGENAESVALLQLEGRLHERLRQRLRALVVNARRIIAVNRNLSFFTTSYAYGIQLLPALIVGPLFIGGKVEFGVITQSAMAFSHLLGAFSLIVTQIQQLSSYAAVLVRLSTLTGAIERASPPAVTPSEDHEGPERLIYDDLTLHSRSGEPLIAHLTVTVPRGTRLLITGTDEARRALFRATALGRDAPKGHIVRPSNEQMLFLPERPYVALGTLRELLLRAGHEHDVSDERIHQVLRDLGLESALKRVGGLEVEVDWGHTLSLGEQQLLTVARVILAKPAFAVLQSPGTTLAPEQLARALALLTEASITYLAFGGDDSSPGAYDAVLELHASGTWSFRHP